MFNIIVGMDNKEEAGNIEGIQEVIILKMGMPLVGLALTIMYML